MFKDHYNISSFSPTITILSALILDAQDEVALTKRKEAEKKKKAQDRDKRKQDLALKKERARKMAMIAAVKERGLRVGDLADLGDKIDLEDVQAVDALDMSAFESNHPGGATVVINDDQTMSWPVMLLYPEYGETDFIQSFHEATTFQTHVEAMFNAANRPPWDVEGKYTPENILLFYEDKKNSKLVPVSQERTLLEALREPTHRIYGGTPAFIALPNNCKFFIEYLKHYERATS